MSAAFDFGSAWEMMPPVWTLATKVQINFKGGRQECPPHTTLFDFQEKSRQRRQGQAHRERPPMRGHRFRVDASQVPHAASAVVLGVAIEKFFPISSRWHADPVSVTRYGGEIANDHNLISWKSAFAQQGNNTGSRVIAVDPLKPGGVGVELMQAGLLAINLV